MKLLRRVPAVLIASRLLLGPILLLLCVQHAASSWIAAALIAAFLSDIFDGIVARRVGVATERLRVADSWADAFFYFWIVAAVCFSVPKVVYTFRMPLLLVAGLQLFSYLIDLLKYRRIATFHAYSAKVWGIMLFIATIALLAYHRDGVYLWAAIAFGILSNIEGMAMKLVLPTWQYDVPSLFHAWRLRRHLLSGRKIG